MPILREDDLQMAHPVLTPRAKGPKRAKSALRGALVMMAGLSLAACGAESTGNSVPLAARNGETAGPWRLLPDLPGALALADLDGVQGIWTGEQALFVGNVARAETLLLLGYDPVDDVWEELATPPGGPRYGYHLSLRGDSLLMLGGGTRQADPRGAEYSVTSGTWQAVEPLPKQVSEVIGESAVRLRGGPASSVLYWGGMASDYSATGLGWLVDVGTGEATAIPPSPLSPRFNHTAVWTGEEVLIWGGSDDGKRAFSGHEHDRTLNDGAAYRPAAQAWRMLAPSPFSGAAFHTEALWTGSEMIVLKGRAGAAYDPDKDAWRSLPEAPLEFSPEGEAVWTGDSVLVFGPEGGARLSLANNAWERLPDAPGPARSDATALWVGNEMLVVGGNKKGTDTPVTRGLAYRP